MDSNRIGSLLGALGGSLLLAFALWFRHVHPLVVLGSALGLGLVLFGIAVLLHRIAGPAIATSTTGFLALACTIGAFVKVPPQVNEAEVIEKLGSQIMIAEVGEEPANLDLSYSRYGRYLPVVQTVHSLSVEMCEEAKAYRHQQGFFLHAGSPERWLKDKDRAASLKALEELKSSLERLRSLEHRLVGQPMEAELARMDLPPAFKEALLQSFANQAQFRSVREWMDNEDRLIALLGKIYRRLTPQEVTFTPPHTVLFHHPKTMEAHRADLADMEALLGESIRLSRATRIVIAQQK